MTLNGIKNIIFDFGGVICDLHPQRCLDQFRQLGCEINMFPTQYSQFDGVFKQIDRGDISMEEFYENIRQQGKVPNATDEQIQQAWLSVLGEIPDERFEAFDRLRRNYRLYILSNCNDLHWEHLSRKRMVYRGENIMHWFSQLFLSYKLHLEKPEPEIYQAVLDMAGIKAEESLFIDDNQPNLDAAAKMGFHTLLSTSGDWVEKLRVQASPQPLVLTIGGFDGVHRGHLYLLQQLKETARERKAATGVVTFRNHPSATLSPDRPQQLLTSLEEKMQLLEAQAINRVVVLDFTPQMAAMSARDFMDQVLKQELHASTLLMGYDHRFGHGATTTFSDCQRYGRELGIEVLLAQEFKATNPKSQKISSSAIRKALAEGDVALAAQMLGRPYSIDGTVVHGEGIGRSMGFPTANIKLSDTQKLLPQRGAYAVEVLVGDTAHRGMLYIGNRPTFDGLNELRIEVHILDFEGNIYNQHLSIRFLQFLRGEQHFASAGELQAQLEKDLTRVKETKSLRV